MREHRARLVQGVRILTRRIEGDIPDGKTEQRNRATSHVPVSGGAAVTKRPRLRGLQLQTFIFSPSWRLEVGGQGVGRSIFSRVVSPWLVDSPVFPVTTCGHPSVPACLFSIPITRNKDPPCERINLLTTLKAVSPNTVLA